MSSRMEGECYRVLWKLEYHLLIFALISALFQASTRTVSRSSPPAPLRRSADPPFGRAVRSAFQQVWVMADKVGDQLPFTEYMSFAEELVHREFGLAPASFRRSPRAFLRPSCPH